MRFYSSGIVFAVLLCLVVKNAQASGMHVHTYSVKTILNNVNINV